MDVELIRDKINVITGHGPRGKPLGSPEPCSSQESNVRYAPQLLTMTSLNKMLQVSCRNQNILIEVVVVYYIFCSIENVSNLKQVLKKL